MLLPDPIVPVDVLINIIHAIQNEEREREAHSGEPGLWRNCQLVSINFHANIHTREWV